MLAVIANGEHTFRLVDMTGRDVGWVRAKTIGFGGLVSESAAHAAALDGARALARCLKQEFGVTQVELRERPKTRTVRYGDAEWVVDGRVRIARLLRMETAAGNDEAFGIEFQLPRYANDAVAINAALIVYGALSRELVPMTESRDPHAASSAAG